MARKKKRRPPEPSGPKGAPEWVVTFTDMISLLVTFFVLLMTFSSLEQYDVLKIDAWLDGKGSIHKVTGFTIQQPLEHDQVAATDVQRGAMLPHVRPAEKLPESLADMGQKKTAEHLELDLEQVADGLVIEFGAEQSFLPGSAVLAPGLRRQLGEIGRVLENYPHLVVVEGFTDGAFKPSALHPDAESLSFARASSAAGALLAESRLRSELVQVAGLGAARPRADDETLEGRRQNRRIQLRILSLSRARASHLEALEREEEG